MTSFTPFITILSSLKDERELEDFLIGITTPQEREALSQRVEIVKALIAGEPQHTIAKRLGVGVATVTRGSKELADGHFEYLREAQS